MNYIFTDGACTNNGKHNARAGIGVFFGNDDPRNVSQELKTDKLTNQVAELTAAIVAIKAAVKSGIPDGKFTIVTDSDYVYKIVTSWAYNWSKNGWKTSKNTPVLNSEIIQKLFHLKQKHSVKFKQVRSHLVAPPSSASKIEKLFWEGNYMADLLAVNAIDKR